MPSEKQLRGLTNPLLKSAMDRGFRWTRYHSGSPRVRHRCSSFWDGKLLKIRRALERTARTTHKEFFHLPTATVEKGSWGVAALQSSRQARRELQDGIALQRDRW